MLASTLASIFLVLTNQPAGEPEPSAPDTWNAFYIQSARQYELTRTPDDVGIPINEEPILQWASINDYHGGVFAWCEEGRPVLIGTIFSFMPGGSDRRTAVHEFASFAESEVIVRGPGDEQWTPPPVGELQQVPGAATPPDDANRLRLQCRRLARQFSAHLNRQGVRWDLRLLPTPLLEYSQVSDEILGGGLFAFVGYSTDPEILLLIEARRSDEETAWFFHPVRFSDKGLYLDCNDQRVWESLRAAHGGDGTDTDDPQYRVLASERLPQELSERLSSATETE